MLNTNFEHEKVLRTYIYEERSISQVFIMSLGEFGDLWDAIDGTQYIMIGDKSFQHIEALVIIVGQSNCNVLSPGKIHGFLFIAILVHIVL